MKNLKLVKLACAALIICGHLNIANAQQPIQPQPNQSEFMLRLKANDVNVIGKALAKLPFEEVADLIQSMRSQIIEQQSPKVEPSKDAPK